ncbi:MAG: hypothetical protein ABUL49_00495, partial [bacterium]
MLLTADSEIAVGLELLVGVGLGLIAMGFIDYLYYRWYSKRFVLEAAGLKEIGRKHQEEANALRQELAETRQNLALAEMSPGSKIDPLFATTMPRTQSVTTGSPEFEAVKSRIGEIMSQNIVL